MEKKLLVLAALAAASCAHAQSTVNLFGVVDLNIGHYSLSGTSKDASVTKMGHNGIASSQLGFRGTEDLGGGMHAGFWLEAGLVPQNGNANGLQFERRSTVDLGGSFGAIRLGRDYSPEFWNKTVFDPFGTNGAGSAQVADLGTSPTTAVRTSNGISYLYGFEPNATSHIGKGFYLQATYGVPGNPSGTPNDGANTGIRVGYSTDVLNTAMGYGKTKNAAANDYTTWNLGASYDLKSVKLIGNFNQNKTGNGAFNYKYYLFGLTAPAGETGLIIASYSRLTSNGSFDSGGKADKYAIGYIHSLSKRTAVYATYAYVRNNDQMLTVVVTGSPKAAATDFGGRSSGFDVGLKHSF